MSKKISIDYTYTIPFIKEKEIEEYKNDVINAMDQLFSKKGKGNDFLGWLDLPSKVLSSDYYNDILEIGNEIYNNADLIIIIGIGGSYLGAKAVIEAFKQPFHNFKNKKERNGPKFIFAGQNISGAWMDAVLKEIDSAESVYINVISKSGTTTEPGIAFRTIKKVIEKKYGKIEASKRIIATTDAKKGALRTLSEKEQYRTFIIPDDVGGRYSVFTPVGLLPIASVGIDITKLLKGAQNAQDYGQEKKIEKNPAAFYALIRNLLLKKKYTTEILVNYEPNLHFISEWWKQLYGESEGKDKKGIFPASVDFTTDLHSMGQWIQDGQRFIFETILRIMKSSSSLDVPSDNQNLDGLEYLAGKTFYEINNKALEGTLLAHYEGNVPNIIFNIPELSTECIGELLYVFEEACGISGYLLDVNPFNQPGVEAYKKNMFALLDKPGDIHQENKKNINDKIKSLPKSKKTS